LQHGFVHESAVARGMLGVVAGGTPTMLATTDSPTLSLPEISLPLPVSQEATRAVVFQSDELLQGRREAWIEHRGEMYRLRLTGSGKLYLTK
jgi:hemin uptake protein HemP